MPRTTISIPTAPARKRSRTQRKWKRKFSRKVARPLVNKCYCKRFVVKATIAGNDTTPYNGQSFKWNLNDIPGVSDFTNMFDQYQIAGIAYRFVVNKDEQAGSIVAANRGNYIRLMMVNDYNDSTSPTSFSELQQYPYVKEMWLTDTKPVTKWFYQKPTVLNTINSQVLNNYNPMRKCWIDTSYPGTDHYGLKIFYEGHYAGRTLILECKYYIKLKEIR